MSTDPFVTPLVFTNSSFPSGNTHRSGFFKSLYDTNTLPTQLPNNKPFCMCYTYSKNFYYKPHTDSGMVGTSAAAYLARRKRM